MFCRCFWKDPKGDFRNYDKEAKKIKIGVVNNWGFFNVENSWFRVERQVRILVILYLFDIYICAK